MTANFLDYNTFLIIHENQLTSSGVPQRYWHTLFTKLKSELYDAGMVFEMQQDSEKANNSINGGWKVVSTSYHALRPDDSMHIFLIDHAWTYELEDMRAALDAIPGLVDRMMNLMNINPDELNKEEQKETVLETMWIFNQTYSFGNFDLGSDAAKPKWYIMDEFGSRIQHSDKPSFRIAPFFFADAGIAFSIMWPIVKVSKGDEVTRDYIHQELDSDRRRARLIPWIPQDMTDINFTPSEEDSPYFKRYTQMETRPLSDFAFPGLAKDKNPKVYIEYAVLKDNLTDKRFDIVDDPADADILWYFSHYHDFKKFSETRPSCLINQFPCENVVTVKDLLAIAARRATPSESDESTPKWLPITYNLSTELAKFVSYFQHREKRGLDNHWICKPWNLARGLDTHVTTNLNRIIRVPESGPKVACKYVEDPVLFFRSDIECNVKFDLRFIVLLSSVKPLKLYAYEVFFLRFANKPFSLDSLNDYEKHFTVMNYHEDTVLYQLHYDDFVPKFELQHSGFLWKDVTNDIFTAIKELFEAAVSQPPPRGICHSPQSRAMYGVDLLLAWETSPTGQKIIQPKICEVNFAPDCTRACKYHPSFANDVFSVLFLDETQDRRVVAL